MSEKRYLNLLAIVDVVLDTYHYGGGANTVYDAFAARTPLVTLPTLFQRGRWALAVAQKLDIIEPVAGSPAEYIEIAVQLANDPNFRTAVVAKIEGQRDALFEDMNAVTEIQDFFIKVCL